MILPNGTPLARVTAAAILTIVLALIWLILVDPLVTAYDQAVFEVRQLRAQLITTRNRTENGDALRGELDSLRSQISDRALLMENVSDGAAVARLQQRVEGLLERSDARLSSVQALPVRPSDGFRQVGLRLQFSADVVSLRAVLHGLEFGQPAVVLENTFVHARTDRAVGLARPLTVRTDVFAFLTGNSADAGR